MDTQRFNKWHQYLQHDFLLDLCVKQGPRPSADICHFIIRNPNFKRKQYEAALPYARLDRFRRETPPLSDEEFDRFIDMTTPGQRDESQQPYIAEALGRVTTAQLQVINMYDPNFMVFWIPRLRRGQATRFALNMHIDIFGALQALPYLNMVDYANDVPFVIAGRPDMNVRAARILRNFISEASTRHIIPKSARCLARLASNPALSADDVIEACGEIPQVVLNQSFTQECCRSPRFQYLLRPSNANASVYFEGNCNFFDFTRRDILPKTLYARMNPSYATHGLGRTATASIAWELAQNEYTKNAHWRAICLGRAAKRDEWLSTTWRALNAYLPNALVALVLDIWYTPLFYTAPQAGGVNFDFSIATTTRCAPALCAPIATITWSIVINGAAA